MRMGTKSESAFSDRAGEVRKRRTERSQKRINTVGQRVANPVNSRPVVFRGTKTFGTPIHRQAGKRARRQLYLTMDQAAGTELRLPAIPLLNPGWRLLSALLVALAGLGIFSLWNSPFFRVYSVDIQGLQRLDTTEVATSLALEDVSIVEVDPAIIQAELTKYYPELTDIQVSVEIPNYVSIQVTERQPVMAWQTPEEVTFIDAEGVPFPMRGQLDGLLTIHSTDDLPMLPVIPEGLEESAPAEDAEKAEETDALAGQTGRADPALLSAAQQLSQHMPPETVLVYDNLNGIGWIDSQGWRVYIGADLSNFEAKFNMYQNLAVYLVEQGLRPTLVSVAQINAPFYRLEQ